MTIKQIVDAIQADSRLDGVIYGIGRKFWRQNRRPPRVAWIPTLVAYDAPDDTDRRLPTAATSTRQVATRVQTFEIKCHGQDVEQTELLADAVVAATWKQARGSQAWGSGGFDTEQTSTGHYATDGEVLTFTLQLRLPVNEDAMGTARSMTVVAGHAHAGYFGPATLWNFGTWGGSTLWGSPELGC